MQNTENKDVLKYSKKMEEIPFDLKIASDFPLKLTFLKAASGNHILGYCPLWEGEFLDPEVIFSNVSPSSLIPSVSSFEFDKDMTGAEIDFFLVNDGFNLNQHLNSFDDIIAGKNGRLAFVDRYDEWQNILIKQDDGDIVWANKETLEPVAEVNLATVKSVNPLLIWIPDDDAKIEMIAGHIFHTMAKEGKLSLNPDGFKHAAVFLDNMPKTTLSFGFCELLEPETGVFNDVRFRLLIGEENYKRLCPSTIMNNFSLDEVEENILSSVIIKIANGVKKGDRLVPCGILIEDDGVIDGIGIGITNLENDTCILLDGKATKNIYENVLNHIRFVNNNGEETAEEERTITFKIMTEDGAYNMSCSALPNGSYLAGEETNDLPQEEEPSSYEYDEGESDLEEDKMIADVAKFLQEEPLSGKSTNAPIKKEPEQEQVTPVQQDEQVGSDSDVSYVDGIVNRVEKSVLHPTALTSSERKTVLITGGARRVGKELALSFAKDGWNVIIHCNNSLDEARALAKEITKCKVRTAVLQADLQDESEVVQIFSQVLNVFTKIDCLVNNASVFIKDDFFDSPADVWEKQMMVNLRSPFLLSQHFARQFTGGGNGVGNIINITDARVLNTEDTFFSYNLSKIAFAHMTEMTAKILAPYVRVNAVAPWKLLPSVYGNAKGLEKAIDESPLKQKTSLIEVYKAIKFFIDSPSVTGKTITFDSGMYV